MSAASLDDLERRLLGSADDSAHRPYYDLSAVEDDEA
ncbi:hypothetical protein C8E83_0325 [Frondihabitans australicus]|uniref:Uncharacterized protein n=1 Tax=Frondihabitans australicus TaxID=386892 RepID=A0A495IDN5_9MICO|nr:hypothetical protein C8E83_0325 [Frondihabitans australicus]